MIPNIKLLPDSLYYTELHARLAAARQRVLVSIFLFSPRWYDKHVNLLLDFTEASRRGCQCKIIMSAAPIKIGRRRPNQDTAQQLKDAGWDIRIMAGSRTLHEKMIVVDDEFLFLGSHNLAWSSIARNCETSIVLHDRDINAQGERIFWERWKIASKLDHKAWDLTTPLDMPFIP